MRYKILTVDDSKTVRIIVRKAFKTLRLRNPRSRQRR